MVKSLFYDSSSDIFRLAKLASSPIFMHLDHVVNDRACLGSIHNSQHAFASIWQWSDHCPLLVWITTKFCNALMADISHIIKGKNTIEETNQDVRTRDSIKGTWLACTRHKKTSLLTLEFGYGLGTTLVFGDGSDRYNPYSSCPRPRFHSGTRSWKTQWGVKRCARN